VALLSYFRKCQCNLEFCWLWTSYKPCNYSYSFCCNLCFVNFLSVWPITLILLDKWALSSKFNILSRWISAFSFKCSIESSVKNFFNVLSPIISVNSIQWSRSASNAHCRLCRRRGDAENMLLCDGCNKGHHLYCLKPKLIVRWYSYVTSLFLDISFLRTYVLLFDCYKISYSYRWHKYGLTLTFNPLNAELNPICHLLALLGAHHILHVSRIRVKNRASYI